MPDIDIESTFGPRIEKIFSDASLTKKYSYAVPKSIKTQALLFVGINPSLPKKRHARKEFYDSHASEHPYFTKFPTLAPEGLPWTHIDLLFVRQTSQSAVKAMWENPSSPVEKKFLREQLELSKCMIEMARPRIIVVCNTLARDMMQEGEQQKKEEKIFDFTFVFDKGIGTHRIKNHPKLGEVPVFFTSMLTGQRALDNGSFERLEWHIEQVNSKLKNGAIRASEK